MVAAPHRTDARGAARPDVRVVLEGLEPATPGVRVQVFDDARDPQLVLESTSGAVVEVLDDAGRAFLRIDATGVTADVAAAAWFRTLCPGGAPVAAHGVALDAAWRAVRRQPSWGWFDPRLAVAGLDRASGAGPRTAASWCIPARIDGRAAAIRGHFRLAPHPTGAFVAQLTSRGELAPGVRVALSKGPAPILLLANAGPHPVTVLGLADEPFLRIAREGVDANLASPTWQDCRRHDGLEVDITPNDGVVRWQRVSVAPAYRWREPRAAMPAVELPRGADNARAKVKGWRVPLRLGDRPTAIQGIIEWVPAPVATTPLKGSG